jgi:hypothetical protein
MPNQPPSSETMIAVGAMLVTFALAMLIGGVVGVRWWLPLFAFLMATGVTMILVQFTPRR